MYFLHGDPSEWGRKDLDSATTAVDIIQTFLTFERLRNGSATAALLSLPSISLPLSLFASIALAFERRTAGRSGGREREGLRGKIKPTKHDLSTFETANDHVRARVGAFHHGAVGEVVSHFRHGPSEWRRVQRVYIQNKTTRSKRTHIFF